MNAAASMLQSAQIPDRDFRRLNLSDKHYAPRIAAAFKEIKRWEDVPHRREACEVEMLLQLRKELQESGADPLGLRMALLDWFILGLSAGYRRSEWCQDEGNSNPATPQKNFRGETQAFTSLDFEFLLHGNRLVSAATALNFTEKDLQAASNCWKTQKNGDHGEKRLFYNSGNGPLQPATAAHRVVKRFHELLGIHNTTAPLAIYRDNNGHVKAITSKDVKRELQYLASVVYSINPTSEKGAEALSRWTSHSLRVGACTTLHAKGFTDVQLQQLLRWRSTAFMRYLRNTRVLGLRATDALNEDFTDRPAPQYNREDPMPSVLS
jgi:hypothetical protein